LSGERTWKKRASAQLWYRPINIFSKKRAENFFLEIGQYGYHEMQNFTLIPNPKAKLKKTHAKKLFSKNCFFDQFLK
jgi:hypothetical protein